MVLKQALGSRVKYSLSWIEKAVFPEVHQPENNSAKEDISMKECPLFFPVRWRTTPWRFFYGNRNPPVVRRFAHRVPAVLTLPFFFGDANLGQVVAVLCAQDAAPPPVFPELAEPAVGRTST